MKIGYLGTGVWGFCLARLLAKKGHTVIGWSIDKQVVDAIQKTKCHPSFPTYPVVGDIQFTTHLEKALDGADVMIESVTSSGMRPAFEQVKKISIPKCPIVLTSKGIEQDTGHVLSDVIIDVLGESIRGQVGSLSGPSFAEEVIQDLPTSVVGSAYSEKTMMLVCELFSTQTLRVYPNPDMRGVAYGGALKNIIAIACGIVEGLGLGKSAVAALITRGLHEMRKLAVAQGCLSETLYGLSGMGDLILTCGSLMSRNYRFGYLLSQGKSTQEARGEIGMVIEGAYSTISALQLSKKLGVAMPITEMVYSIINDGLSPKDAVGILMEREIKLEYL